MGRAVGLAYRFDLIRRVAELARRPPADPLGRGRGPADPHRDGPLRPLLRARRGHLRPRGAARRRRGGRHGRRRRRAPARRRRRPRRGRGRGRARRRRCGVTGVPTFLVGGHYAVSGAQPPEPLDPPRRRDRRGGRRHESRSSTSPAAARSSPAPARASASRSPQGLAAHGAAVVLNARDPDRLAAAAAAHPRRRDRRLRRHRPRRRRRRGRPASRPARPDRHPRQQRRHAVPRAARGLPASTSGQQLLATNVSSAFYVGQAVARRMIPRGRGRIINIASVQASSPAPASPPTPPPRARSAT